MVVVMKSDLNKVSELARQMECYYNYRSFVWENEALCEIHSPCNPFLALVKKRFMENNSVCKYFIDLK